MLKASLFVLGAAALLSTAAMTSEAVAQPKAKPASKAKKAAQPAKAPAKGRARKAEPADAAGGAEGPESTQAAGMAAAKAGPGESAVQAAGTSARGAPAPAAKPVKEEESKEGVKTYEFGAVEVEGRLRSPQILYFLRRVRAEFDAGTLGHRSFLGELADTRNDSAFR